MQRFGVGHLVMVGGVCWFEGGWVFGRIGEKSIGVGDCGGGGGLFCVSCSGVFGRVVWMERGMG